MVRIRDRAQVPGSRSGIEVFDGPAQLRPDSGRLQVAPGAVPGVGQRAEFIGIPEWCRRVGCSRESGYRAARRGEIPGLFRIGRLKRINWAVFVNAAAHSGAAVPTAIRE